MNWKSLVTFGLVFSFLVSKELIVLNEEILIAICFVLFIYLLVNSFSSVIVESLEERSSSLSKEFDQFFVAEQNQLALLIEYYNRQLSFIPRLKGLFSFLKNSKGILVKDVSTEISNYYIENIKYLLSIIRLREENLVFSVHNYFITRTYLSSSHFSTILPKLRKKFPTRYRRKVLVSTMRAFS